ncbi:unnamed protein product [Closterium sp. NIES-64]|nr:unnamed protein product [Closterium sp. NIES-64]
MKTEPKLRPVGFNPLSRCSSLPSRIALHFPLPLLFTSLSRCSSLPSTVVLAPPCYHPAHSPVALSSLAHPVSPTPSLLPVSLFAGAIAPSVSVGQQHHQRLCLATPRLPPPALLQPRLDCPLPPPVHLSLTALLVPHCPFPTIGFPLPSSSSCPSASSPSSAHSSSASSTPLTHLGLSGASVAPPSSLFPSHELASFTHLDPSHSRGATLPTPYLTTLHRTPILLHALTPRRAASIGYKQQYPLRTSTSLLLLTLTP